MAEDKPVERTYRVVKKTDGERVPVLVAEREAYENGVSVIQRGVVLVQVESETEPGQLVTRKVNLECLDDLDSAESKFYERERQKIMRSLYPAELPLRAHPFVWSDGTPIAKPTLRERLARATYPLRARLASWLVGWDVTADQDGD